MDGYLVLLVSQLIEKIKDFAGPASFHIDVFHAVVEDTVFLGLMHIYGHFAVDGEYFHWAGCPEWA